MEKLYILDGYGYIFRAYYGVASAGGGSTLTTKAGFPTGALYVYTQMLLRLSKEIKPKRIVVAFDHKGKTFRHDLYSEYKANRSAPPDDLVAQFPYFRQITEAFNWPVISVKGFEADDVIATTTCLAREKHLAVTIFSGDKDLMALVSDHVEMIDPMRRKTYDAKAVEEKFGVPPGQVTDYLSLVGDASDNVPGMQGVGKKTAAKFLSQYGSLDALLENTSALKGKMRERFEDPKLIEKLHLSKALVTLDNRVELPIDIETMVAKPWDSDNLGSLFEELEFFALKKRLGGRNDDGEKSVASSVVDAKSSCVESLSDIKIATKSSELRKFVKTLRSEGVYAIHLVSDLRRHDREAVVGFSLVSKSSGALYIPMGHRYLGMPVMLKVADIQDITSLFADRDCTMVCHDSKTLLRRLKNLGFDVDNKVEDTLVLSYLLSATTDLHDPVSCLGGESLSIKKEIDLLGKGKSKTTYEFLRVEEASHYVAYVAFLVLIKYEELIKENNNKGMSGLYEDLELPLCSILADMENRGILLDKDCFKSISDQVVRSIGDDEKKIYELAGESFNIGSPKQLSSILFEKLGLRSDKMKKRKTGYSTDQEVLHGMLDKHSIVRPILNVRELVKLKTTYLDALPPLVSEKTGRLHTLFRNANTATGRLSSQEPNLQNIPIRSKIGREIRKGFVAERGHCFVSADYSQIELRVVTHLSGDPVLKKIFKDGGDVHKQTAAEVFGVDPKDVTKNERRVAKAVNYGLMYGQTNFGLARALEIPVFEAKNYIERYFGRFKRLAQFMKDAVAEALRCGYATTLSGRRRYLPDIDHKNKNLRAAAERMAQNTPVQGSAADILKKAMIDVDRELKNIPSAKMLLTVHDELVIEVLEEHVDDCIQVVRHEMVNAYRLSVPLVVDIGVGKNWCDAH